MYKKIIPTFAPLDNDFKVIEYVECIADEMFLMENTHHFMVYLFKMGCPTDYLTELVRDYNNKYKMLKKNKFEYLNRFTYKVYMTDYIQQFKNQDEEN